MKRLSFHLIISFFSQILSLITFIEPTFYNEVLRLNILNSLNHPFYKEDVYWELRGMLWWQEPKLSLSSSLPFAKVLALPLNTWSYANTKLTCWFHMVPYDSLVPTRIDPFATLLYSCNLFSGDLGYTCIVLSTMQISCWFETVWFIRVKIEKLMCGVLTPDQCWAVLSFLPKQLVGRGCIYRTLIGGSQKNQRTRFVGIPQLNQTGVPTLNFFGKPDLFVRGN
jgi:hypothetical protein